MKDVPVDSELDWGLVLAPFRKDADYVAAFLREQKIEVNLDAAGEILDRS